MTRLEFIRKKHHTPIQNIMAHAVSKEHIKLKSALMRTKEVPSHTCGECVKFRDWKSNCTYKKQIKEGTIIGTDPACDDFERKTGRGGRADRGGRAGRGGRAKKQKEETFELDLYAPVPETYKPCGFFGDTLTESVWLPYRDQDRNVTLRPSLIIAEKGKEPRITDFLTGYHNIKGVFPSQDLQSLMSVKGAQMLTSNTTIEPQTVDKLIDDAFRKHLSMPDAERVLSKRFIEGSFFYDVFDAYAIQNILGVSESGKSRLSLLNLALCYHAEGLIDPTEASIFRSKEEDKVSLIIDEAEYLNNPNLYSTLRILLNASYSKYSGYVTRYDEINGKRIKRRFDLYSPMSISGIGGLEGVTASRAFKIIMRRVDKDFPKANPQDYRELRDKLYVLRIRHAFELHDLYKKTDISDIVTARFEELFRPFFALTAWLGTKEEWDILKDWCSEYQATFRIEALNVAAEEQLLLCIPKLSKIEGQPDWYSLKELADKINIEYNRKVSSGYVTNLLTRLGITKRKKIKGYTLFYCSEELLEECAGRIGLPFDSTSSTCSTASTQQRPNEQWVKHAEEIEPHMSEGD